MTTFTGPAEDVDAIRTIRADIERAVNDGDAGALGRHFADDIAQLPAYGATRGKEAVVEESRQSYEAADIDETFTIEDITVLGDLAVERGTYAITVRPKDGSDPFGGEGLEYLYVHERQTDGSWKVLRMTWRSWFES